MIEQCRGFEIVNYDLAEERNERVGGIYAPHAPRIVLPRESVQTYFYSGALSPAATQFGEREGNRFPSLLRLVSLLNHNLLT